MGTKSSGKEQIAQERIETLFEQAAEMAAEHPNRADRYVEIARNIAMKFNMSIPQEYRRKFCPHCYAYLSADRTRVRIKDGKKVVTCKECGETHRYVYENTDEDSDDTEDDSE